MGRSLSLVSRYMHDASKAVRFQMVTCRNAAQIIAFAFILDRTLPRYIISFAIYSCRVALAIPPHRGFARMKSQRMSHTPFGSPTASHPPLSTMIMHPVEKVIVFHTLMSTYRHALSVIPCILSRAAQTLTSLTPYRLAVVGNIILFPSHLPVLLTLQ
jgi:hypothetical protein